MTNPCWIPREPVTVVSYYSVRSTMSNPRYVCVNCVCCLVYSTHLINCKSDRGFTPNKIRQPPSWVTRWFFLVLLLHCWTGWLNMYLHTHNVWTETDDDLASPVWRSTHYCERRRHTLTWGAFNEWIHLCRHSDVTTTGDKRASPPRNQLHTHTWQTCIQRSVHSYTWCEVVVFENIRLAIGE